MIFTYSDDAYGCCTLLEEWDPEYTKRVNIMDGGFNPQEKVNSQGIYMVDILVSY